MPGAVVVDLSEVRTFRDRARQYALAASGQTPADAEALLRLAEAFRLRATLLSRSGRG